MSIMSEHSEKKNNKEKTKQIDSFHWVDHDYDCCTAANIVESS